jgi:hypothetical protein
LAATDKTATVAAFAYFRGDLSVSGRSSLNSSSALDGAVAAMFFRHPSIASRAAASQIEAFEKQRAAIDSFRDQIEARFDALKTEAEEWKALDQGKAQTLLSEQKQSFETQQTSLANEHTIQSDAYAKWLAEAQQKIVDLETLYRDNLQLEKPAQYWKKLEQKYVRQGLYGTGTAVLFVLGIAMWVTHLVYQPPDLFKSENFTLGGVKGALLVAAAVSAMLYLANLLVKLATSSFHLARDARERYQLTYVYLALKQEGALQDKEREIILSALFSRSDTGLLKGDSGPSFPPTPLASILEHVVKNK